MAFLRPLTANSTSYPALVAPLADKSDERGERHTASHYELDLRMPTDSFRTD